MKNVQKLALVILVAGLVGCGLTTAQVKSGASTLIADAHTLASAGLGQVTAALEDPTGLEEAKATVGALAQAVDPKLAPAVTAALAHLNAGNLTNAQSILKVVVALTPPIAPAPASPQ